MDKSRDLDISKITAQEYVPRSSPGSLGNTARVRGPGTHEVTHVLAARGISLSKGNECSGPESV